MNGIVSVVGIVIAIMFVLLLILHFINLKLNLKTIKVLIKIIGTIIAILFVVATLGFFLYLFITLFVIIYSLFKLLLTLVIPEKIGAYFAFVITLIIYGYFPEKIGYCLLKLFEKLEGGKRNGFSEGYKSVIKFLRPKLWLYFIAFILTVVASVEKILYVNLVNYAIWIENKDYLFEAVVTFLAFDSFISLFKEQYKKITNEVLNITKYIRDGVNDIKLDK